MPESVPLASRARFVVLDFETTGAVAGWPVEPWQLGLVHVDEGRIRSEGFESLLRVAADRPFNPHAPGRHAQVRDRLAVAPTLTELWPTLAGRVMGVPLVAHNIGTERSLLAQALPMHRLGPWLDTLRLVRRYYPGLASAGLGQVVASLGLQSRVAQCCPGRQCHDALYDAFACALLLEHFLQLPGWERVTVPALLEGY